MRGTKKNVKIIIFTLAGFLILGGSLYYKIVLGQQLEAIQVLAEENQLKAEELEVLKQEFQLLEQTKNELENIYMETKVLEERMPTYEMPVMAMTEVIQYMEAYNYQDTFVDVGKPIWEEEQEYCAVPVTISYTTTYENTVNFLEMLNRSYQMITIDNYFIDNAVQEKASEDGAAYVSKDIVETQLKLKMYYKGQKDVEVYPNFMAYLEQEEDVFARSFSLDLEVEDLLDEQGHDQTVFNIYLADILRSGDNYSFSGCSPNQEPVYVGLVSATDTKIVITVRDNGYTCQIEDSEGNENEKTVEGAVENLSINITSQIQKVMDLMPITSIYVHNDTPDIITVNLRGTSLETVLIYNEDDKLVAPGRQRGKVVVSG